MPPAGACLSSWASIRPHAVSARSRQSTPARRSLASRWSMPAHCTMDNAGHSTAVEPDCLLRGEECRRRSHEPGGRPSLPRARPARSSRRRTDPRVAARPPRPRRAGWPRRVVPRLAMSSGVVVGPKLVPGDGRPAVAPTRGHSTRRARWISRWLVTFTELVGRLPRAASTTARHTPPGNAAHRIRLRIAHLRDRPNRSLTGRGPIRHRPPPPAREVRTLTEITLPCAKRAKPWKTGCAWMQLATLYRSLSLPRPPVVVQSPVSEAGGLAAH